MHAEIIGVKSLLIALLFAISFQAHAAITIQSVGGASYFEVDDNNNYTIYGGMAGTCTGTLDNVSTCNSCVSATGLPVTACNQTSVYPGLQISISFVSDKILSAAPVHITTDEGLLAQEAPEYSPVSAAATGAAGVSFPATLRWSYLCEHDPGLAGSTCTPANTSEQSFGNTARKIYLWVDEDNDGVVDDGEKKTISVKLHYVNAADTTISQQTFCTKADYEGQTPAITTAIGMCGYELGIGDSKFYLQGVYGANGSGTSAPAKSANAPDWFGVALFASTAANVASIPSSTALMEIRQYNANYGLNDNTITGLDNYVNYCLLMGNVNKAKNIYKFNMAGVNATPGNTCGQPSEVIGMLSDKSCFISTAAFGSDMADQVQLLRKFRNEFLLTNEYGKVFVKTYYKLSPPIAHFIEHSEVLKAMTRTALYPFIAMAWLAVNYGLWPVALLIILFFSSLYLVSKKRRALHA